MTVAVGLRLMAAETAQVSTAAAPVVNSPPTVAAGNAESPASTPVRRAQTKVITVDEVMHETEVDPPFVNDDPKPSSGVPYFIVGGVVAAAGGVLLLPCLMSANSHSSEIRNNSCHDEPRVLGLIALGASVPLVVMGFVQISKRKAWKRRNQLPRVVPMVDRDALVLNYTGTF